MKSALLLPAVAGAILTFSAPSYADTAVAAATDLNVRAGPGPQYPVVGVLGAGQSATLRGCLANSKWCTIAEAGGEGWVYSVALHPEKRPGDRIAIALEFIEKSDRFADMSAICGLTFEVYHKALKAMGYYDHFAYDQIDGQVGRLLGVEYWKEGYSVSILPEVKRFSDGKVYPTCVRSIRLLTLP